MTWNIPNILTLLRLLAAPGVVLMFLYFARPWADWFALILFVSAAVTDWFDGYLARSWKQETKLGAMLDPIADKAMVVIALVVIVGYAGMDPWLLLPATLIIFREVFVSGLREFLGAQAGKLKVTKLAKWKTTVQMFAIGLLMLSSVIHPAEGHEPKNELIAQIVFYISLGIGGVGLLVLWTAAWFTIVTGWDYFRKGMPYIRQKEAAARKPAAAKPAPEPGE